LPPHLIAPAAGAFVPIAPLPTLSPQLLKLTASALRFLIRTFPVPPFLLPIYQAASIEYGVPWQVLAAINEIETDFGRDLSVSSAGAVGWMQFLPSTWARFGVSADGRGKPNPYDPIDAIFSAARYLHAAGAATSMAHAIFAYNHAGWYVDSVELRARLLQVLPSGLVDGLFGLMQAGYPVAGRLGADASKAPKLVRIDGQPAAVVAAPGDAPVVAGADARIVAIGDNAALGHYVTLQDSYGDQITYGGLGSVASLYPVVTPQTESTKQLIKRLGLGTGRLRVTKLLAATRMPAAGTAAHASRTAATRGGTASTQAASATGVALANRGVLVKERLFADPDRPASYAAGGSLQLQSSLRSYLLASRRAASDRSNVVLARPLRLAAGDFTLAPLAVGDTILAGTELGRLLGNAGSNGRIIVQIKPAGSKTAIDPRAILSSWMLLGQLTHGSRQINGSGAGSAFDTRNPSLGQLLMSPDVTLQQAVLDDPTISIDACDRDAIANGVVDRRVLAVLAYLSYSHLAPTVSGLSCSQPAGAAPRFNITAINGVPVRGHQRTGGLVDLTDRQLLALQGSVRPSRIISLRRYPWQSSALSLPDHQADIEVDFASAKTAARHAESLVREWRSLSSRLNQLAING
jgi:hypothetical protein